MGGLGVVPVDPCADVRFLSGMLTATPPFWVYFRCGALSSISLESKQGVQPSAHLQFLVSPQSNQRTLEISVTPVVSNVSCLGDPPTRDALLFPPFYDDAPLLVPPNSSEPTPLQSSASPSSNQMTLEISVIPVAPGVGHFDDPLTPNAPLFPPASNVNDAQTFK